MRVKEFEDIVNAQEEGDEKEDKEEKEDNNSSWKNDIEYDANIDIKIGDDAHIKFAMSKDQLFTEMRLKFRDYFDWALVQGQNEYADNFQDCPSDCGIDSRNNMCCTTIKMYPKSKDNKDGHRFIQHQCMDQAVADMSQGVWIDDFYYEYKCKKGDWYGENGVRSAAKSLAAGAATLLLAFSMV